jgi:PAS domain S-box-containing protein
MTKDWLRLRLRALRAIPLRPLAAPLLAAAVAAGIWMWGNGRVQRPMNEATDVRFAASRLRQRLLEARLSAETFLARDVQDPRFFLGVPLPAIEEFSHAVSEAGDRITSLERLRPGDRASTDTLRTQVERYQAVFLKVTELHRRQGYAEWGLEGDWQKALREADAVAAGRPDLTLALLELRATEKDYLLRRDVQLLETSKRQWEALKETARVLGPAGAARLRNALDRYRAAFDEYADIDRQIGVGGEAGLRAEMTKVALDTDAVVRALHEDAIRQAAAVRRRSGTARLLYALLGVLLGVAAGALCARFLPAGREAAAGTAHPVPVAGEPAVAPKAADDLLHLVFAGLPDAVSIKDLTGRYLFVNEACALLMNRPRSEILGRTNRDLLSAEAAEVADANERDILDAGTTLTYEVAHGERTLAVTKGVVRDGQGEIQGFFGISRDVTERKRAEEGLRAKGALLSSVTEQLRAALRDSPEALLAMLDEVAELARIEAGQVELREDHLVPKDVVAGAIHAMETQAREKSLAMSLHVDAAVPEAMIGDAERLRQVLANVLGNAVKATKRGEIQVGVDSFDLGRGLALLRVVVRDTGMGVRAADAGLAIASRLAALMGGRLDFDDAPGGGRLFTFTARLRLVRADVRSAEPSEHVS